MIFQTIEDTYNDKGYFVQLISEVGGSLDGVMFDLEPSATRDERWDFICTFYAFASALVQSGVLIYEVKELLVHSNVVTTQRYAHLSQDRLRHAVERGAQYWEPTFSEQQPLAGLYESSV